MEKILVINTGGTFNKVYNPRRGDLEIDPKGGALDSISQHWLLAYEVINIVGKDSLEMVEEDREQILRIIQNSNFKKIIVVHGTDTIDKTADHLSRVKNKTILLTGAMVPYAINPIEATANFASAYGFLMASKVCGVYISMNGVIKDYKRVRKNKEKGYFE